MNSQEYTKCPYCNYEFAFHYWKSSGEAFMQCYLCGYSKDVSNYNIEYFDSEEEWQEAQDAVDEKTPSFPAKEILPIAKYIAHIIKIIPSEEIVQNYIDFIEEDLGYSSLNGFFEQFSDYMNQDMMCETIKGIFNE